MRIISLHQPYATLAILGFKPWETRNRQTHVRGPIGIHASANMPKDYKAKIHHTPFYEVLKKHSFWRSEVEQRYIFNNVSYFTSSTGILLPLGSILGAVELTDCQTTESWKQWAGYVAGFNDGMLKPELINAFMFGDFTDGRYAWKFENPLPFEAPVPAKGFQGWWNHSTLPF